MNMGYAKTAGSLFTTGSLDRRLQRIGRRSQQLKEAGVAADYDQRPWGLLYRALQDGMGVNPQNFQLIYPFTTWDWATQNVGFLGAAQYDFCAMVPQWSAVGDYTSSGDRFNQAYQEFLNVIAATTEDAALRAKIEEAGEVLTEATNAYTTAYTQATSVYQDDPAVVDNVPPFTAWLGSPAGKGWQIKITAAEGRMNQAQKNYSDLVEQANTPGLGDAQAQFGNKEFYAKLNDPGLATFPKVPNWNISQTARSWVDSIKAGNGPAGATIGFTNRDQSFDYSKTWAEGSLSVQEFFWAVKVGAKWERVTQFESDQELAVGVEFEAVDQITITPSDWYNGAFVRARANGPFKHGYSAYGGDGTQAVFGEKGFIGLVKTAMFVCYKPTFTITTSQSTFNSFLETFKAAGGLRIGPFSFGASGGTAQAGWNASKEGRSFTGTSTSESPLIFGVTIARLPASDKDAADGCAAGEADESVQVGVCYSLSDCQGNVLANGVTKSDCFNYLGGQSWRAAGATRCWEN